MGEEELTKNYIKLVVAPQMGQGIMLNIGKVGEFHFYRASYASTVLAVIVCLSVCLSVCHESELYKDS